MDDIKKSPRLRHFPEVKAPQPYLRNTRVAEAYSLLRTDTLRGAGFDYLAKVADMLRARFFKSSKDGVANRSRHKCGDTIDFDQTHTRLRVVREDRGGQVFFRIFLLCLDQTGAMGQKLNITPWNFVLHKQGWPIQGYFFDFTQAAESRGFNRIPAWRQWQINHKWNLAEWWHYEMAEGLTWDEAMAYLYGSPANSTNPKPKSRRLLGLNDRGEEVRELQSQLSRLGFLHRNDADGIYGFITKLSVQAFQASQDLTRDGLFGPLTRERLDQELIKLLS